ncbi:DUF6894 family protein [Methylobacterium sp. 4-46]|uniref:DUF6894 family protein n=1 Tax=Methylobacterium sp. (strain 4-46) TaxID=426117 RepID=UPI0002F4AFCB|nr:hypothetical protein [Methylobacterium sp. 4-46]
MIKPVSVPRYFFDVKDSTLSVPDEAGLECRDLGDAHRQACALIVDAMTGPEPLALEWQNWRVEVRDEARSLLFSVPFPGERA